MTDSLKGAIRQWNRSPRRFLIQAGGFALIAALLVMAGVSLISEWRFKRRLLESLSTQALVYLPARAIATPAAVIATDAAAATRLLDPMTEGFFLEPHRIELFPRAVAARTASLSTSIEAVPMLVFRFRDPESFLLTSVIGFDWASPGALEAAGCAPGDLLRGSLLHTGDRGVAVVEEDFAFDRHLDVGSVINLGGVLFPVIGVVRTRLKAVDADIFVPLEDVVRIIDRRLTVPLGDEANLVLITFSGADRAGRLEGLRREIAGILPGSRLEEFSPYLPLVQAFDAGNRANAFLLCLIALAIVLVAWRGQAAVLHERAYEIGILKAIGWTDARIADMLHWEAVLPAGIGALYGGLAGLVVSQAPFAARFLAFPSDIGGPAELAILGFCVFLAVAGGLLAGRRSASFIRSRPASWFLGRPGNRS